MSWKGFAIILIVVIGAVLFLYGANYYDSLIGWAGFLIMFVGFFVGIILELYKRVGKKRRQLEAVKLLVFIV